MADLSDLPWVEDDTKVGTGEPFGPTGPEDPNYKEYDGGTEKGTDWEKVLKDTGGKAAELIKGVIDREDKSKDKPNPKDAKDKDKPNSKDAKDKEVNIPNLPIVPPRAASSGPSPGTVGLILGGAALLALVVLLARRKRG